MKVLGRGEANLRFSKQLAIIQISALALLALMVGATTLWISREHDRLLPAA